MANELSTLIDNIESTLAAAASIDITQSYDELEASVLQTPTLQVYPDRCLEVSRGSETDRVTFGGSTGGVVRKVYVIHADIFAAQRHYIAEDMKNLVEYIEEIDAILKAQEKCNIFGDSNVGSFKWEWRRVSFEYSGQQYVGVKYVITVEIM